MLLFLFSVCWKHCSAMLRGKKKPFRGTLEGFLFFFSVVLYFPNCSACSSAYAKKLKKDVIRTLRHTRLCKREV